MPDEFRVTAAMLRHIATKAMALRDEDEVPGSRITRWEPGRWRVCGSGHGAAMDVATEGWGIHRFDFYMATGGDGATIRDTSACDLLMWLVRERGWVVNWLWTNDERSYCAVQAHAPCDECRAVAPTLCEAIIRVILAKSGWEEPAND